MSMLTDASILEAILEKALLLDRETWQDAAESLRATPSNSLEYPERLRTFMAALRNGGERSDLFIRRSLVDVMVYQGTDSFGKWAIFQGIQTPLRVEVRTRMGAGERREVRFSDPVGQIPMLTPPNTTLWQGALRGLISLKSRCN